MISINQSTRRRIKAPAIGLIVEGFLCVASSLWGLMYLLKHRADAQTGVVGVAKHASVLLLIGYSVVIMGIVLSSFVIVGVIQMFRARNYGWALTASILSFVAAFLTAWPLIPIGALVVLIRPGVKDEFAQPVT